MKSIAAILDCGKTTYPINYRVFTNGSEYTGICEHDIWNFLSQRIDAACFWLSDPKLESISQFDNTTIFEMPPSVGFAPNATQKLLILKAKIYESIFKDEIFASQIKNLQIRPEDIQLYEMTFSAIEKYIAQNLRTICLILNSNPVTVKKISSKLNKIIAARVSNSQRPIQLHSYPVHDKTVYEQHRPIAHLTPLQKMVMFESGYNSIPHSIRTMSSIERGKNQFGNCNLLLTEIGVINDGAYQKLYSGFRHGSQSVFEIDDFPLRLFYTIQNIRQILCAALREQLAQRTIDPAIAVELDITEITLLSPIFADALSFDDKKQKRQIADLQLLIPAFDKRVIEIEVAGTNYRVRPNIIYLNLGVNKARGLRDANFEESINCRGLTQLIHSFLECVNAENQLGPFDEWQHALRSQDFYRQFYDQIMRIDLANLHDKYARLESIVTALYFLNSKMHSFDDRSVYEYTSLLNVELNSLIKEIESIETLITEIHHIFYENFREFFARTAADISDKLKEFTKEKSPEAIKWVLFFDALDAYFNTNRGYLGFFAANTRGFTDTLHNNNPFPTGFAKAMGAAAKSYSDNNYQFQIRALALSYLMGRTIEWACASGEDRTGMLNDLLNCLFLYIDKFGLPPRLNHSVDNEQFYSILANTHRCSAQVYTNDQCSPGERGKKVKPEDVAMLPRHIREQVKRGLDLGNLRVTVAESLEEVDTVPVPLRRNVQVPHPKVDVMPDLGSLTNQMAQQMRSEGLSSTEELTVFRAQFRDEQLKALPGLCLSCRGNIAFSETGLNTLMNYYSSSNPPSPSIPKKSEKYQPY